MLKEIKIKIYFLIYNQVLENMYLGHIVGVYLIYKTTIF